MLNFYYTELKNKEAKRFTKSLIGIKSVVDASGPKKVPHLKKRSKKAQIKEKRQSDINYSNQLLMDRMVEIDGRNISKNKNFTKVENSKKSLNRFSRSKNNLRINEENLKFLHRLQSAQPVLSLQK